MQFLKRSFLYTLIASVTLSALLGIAAILSENPDGFEFRILMTTVTIAVASVSGLACGAYLATRRGVLLPWGGIALTIIAAGMFIFGIWTKADTIEYWKFAWSVGVFSVACAHLSLLSIPRMAKRFHWALVAAYLAIFGVALIIVVLIYHGFSNARDGGYFRLLGVAVIIDATMTILILIFHRFSKVEFRALAKGARASAEIDEEIARLRDRLNELERIKRLRP